jgi:hypothetical protein
MRTRYCTSIRITSGSPRSASAAWSTSAKPARAGRPMRTPNTQEESRYLLRNDIARRIAECEQRFEWWGLLDPVRQQVVVCMAFQLGTEGVSKFRRMIAGLKIRDYITASIEMVDSKWHSDTPERCERMANIMRTGVWHASNSP